MENTKSENIPETQPINKKSIQDSVPNLNSAFQVDISTQSNELYPEKIPEPTGDLADRAEIEIEQEIQEQIFRVRQRLYKPNKA